MNIYQKNNLIVQENKPNIKLFYYLIDKIPSKKKWKSLIKIKKKIFDPGNIENKASNFIHIILFILKKIIRQFININRI